MGFLWPALLCLVFFPLVFLSCSREKVAEEFAPSDSYDNYSSALRAMGLDETRLGREWIRNGLAALENPEPASLPFIDTGIFTETMPAARGYRFNAVRGQRVEIVLRLSSKEQSLKVFADLFREEEKGKTRFHQVASYSEEFNLLVFEPRSTGDYILRLQPELLADGEYSVVIGSDPALAFPVKGRDTRHIWSFFGDSRDGGIRKHEGVDIFAPKGTPVLAPARAYVRRVGERDRGGNTVSLYDEERNLIYYFAHLDTQEAVEGTWVEAGDVIGTVGNTGNAVTTPPHLHFGIYEPGFRAVDPWYFLARVAEKADIAYAR